VPIIVKLSIAVYVDLGLIFFSTASLLFLLRWIENGFPLKHLMLSAFFCGLAAGTKYNGLVTIFLLTLFVPFLYSRYSGGGNPGFYKAAGSGMFFLFVALLFFSPWMIRDCFWTNNPIFPLYDQWFNPQYSSTQKPANLFIFRSSMYHESWWEMALLPIRIFFQGQDGNPQYFDGKLNPFLLFLPVFAFYRMGKEPEVLGNEKKIILAFAVLYFCFTFFSRDMRVRYVSPIIPPLVILGIFGVRKMFQGLGGAPFRVPCNI
jgi:4-amino-4-deoxy-L-arabinose transferase-like glycosyltransferase